MAIRHNRPPVFLAGLSRVCRGLSVSLFLYPPYPVFHLQVGIFKLRIGFSLTFP